MHAKEEYVLQMTYLLIGALVDKIVNKAKTMTPIPVKRHMLSLAFQMDKSMNTRKHPVNNIGISIETKQYGAIICLRYF